jgi:hypothetical protein
MAPVRDHAARHRRGRGEGIRVRGLVVPVGAQTADPAGHTAVDLANATWRDI